jgi:hypothetical protein
VEIAADLRQPLSLRWVWSQERASDAPLTELPEGPSEFFPEVNGM